VADPTSIRLPHRMASASEQMALDAALLAWVSASPSRLVFRTYAWARPTLSLGRAEPFPEGWNQSAIAAAGLEVVRRPTGGDAVLHDGELTFSVAASVPGPWDLRPRAFVDRVADALAEALEGFGLPAVRVQDAPAGGPLRPGESPCFARISAGEVRVGGYKVAGIASRFTRGGALSHASVPLSARHRDVASFRASGEADRISLQRHARSAAELLEREIDAEALGNLLAASIESRWGVGMRDSTFAAAGLPEPR
jgi:lipoyl(octanoyl) transferase